MFHKELQKSLIFFTTKACILMLSYWLMRGSSTCWVFSDFNEPIIKENEVEYLESDWCNQTSCDEAESVAEKGRLCRFFKLPKRLMCNGSIDYAYLKTLTDEEIDDFVVENYEAESLYKNKYWSSSELETGEWYLKLPKIYQRLTGKLRLRDLGLEIDVNVRLLPQRSVNGFWIEGEAFSNRVIKISWGLKGNISLNFIKNRTLISLDVGVIGDDDWKLQSNFTFSRRYVEKETDLWRVNGIIALGPSSENQFIYYAGKTWMQVRKDECKFLGEVKLEDVNLDASLIGNVSPPKRKQISIPKSAFSNMMIRNIIFKNSNFYNDFDKNSFEGIRNLKTVSFIDSKLEGFPRLDELFQSFSDLEEIYVEDCTIPQLKFGDTPTLKEVKRLSFKGSGPLNFDDASFLWLKNSRLTFLNLRNSHVKISPKAISVLWTVNETLKHLDISYSNINSDRELNAILKNLTIVTLLAEGLNLKKIPTDALSRVQESLTYLSLRGNNFRKNFESHIFNAILRFPLMVNLKELNLEDCHINYIERGTFDNLPNLKTLYLGYNNLENIQDGWAYVTPQVTHLSLNRNEFISQSVTGLLEAGTSMNLSAFRSLETLDLSDGIFRDINKLVSSLGKGLRNLSLRNTRLEDISNNFFEKLSDLEVLDLSYNRNLMSEKPLSFSLFKNLKKLKALDLKQCRITLDAPYRKNLLDNDNYDEYTLDNLEYLDLSVNKIKILDNKILKAFPNLKVLYLSGNSITEWSTTVLSNEDLETLFLDENKIETITEEMLSDIRRLKHVKLGHNPYVCGSYVYEIIKMINAAANDGSQDGPNRNYLLNESEVLHQDIDLMDNLNQISGGGDEKFLDWSENNYVCYSWSQAKFLQFTQVNEDFQDAVRKKSEGVQTALLWWTGVIFIGLVFSVAIISWKFLDIHLITRAVRNAVAVSFVGRNEKGCTSFKYNVFVSYSDKDRSWVVENLLPRLESNNERQTVCLHERDFQVGLSIIENILNSIESSRNIILVVSQAFLKSQWCQYEMQLAQFRLFEKGRHQLILIFLENIPAFKRPKTLKYLMMTKTYLEWPLNSKNDRDVKMFWNRLMKSLESTN